MDTVADVVAFTLLIATVYVLVRPKSQGVEFVKAFSTAMTAIVKNATDLASTT